MIINYFVGYSKMNIVIDTNTFVLNHFNHKGETKRIVDDCIEKRLRAIYSAQIEQEVICTLNRYRPSVEFMDYVKIFFQHATKIEDNLDLKICKDATDDKFISCALLGKAEYIITEDKLLRKLNGYEGIKIKRAVEFYQENFLPSMNHN